MYAAPVVAVPSPIRRAPKEQREPDAPQAEEGAASLQPPSTEPPPDAAVPVIPESPEGTLLWRVRGMIRSMRPHQWVKNLFVLAPVVFAKELRDPKLIV